MTPTTTPAGPSYDARWFILLWLGLAAIFLGAHYHFYFLEGHLELGDLAADALQIHNAKFLREIFGQYSRWGFHHTGPGFFYLYAIGEWILLDLLRAVPSAYNAHTIVGALFQTGLFVWAIRIVHQHVRARLTIPLMFLFAAIHFGAVSYSIPDSVFVSLWPPHALAFPFLCLLISCASYVSGSSKAILPATICSCFLIHGHVAQPLFVLPLFVSAMALRSLQLRRKRESILTPARECPRQFTAAVIIVLLFLVPLVRDLFHGEQSNLRLIGGHFARHPGERKTLLQSFVYLLTFFGYVAEPEKYCDTLGLESLRFVRDRWIYFTAWLSVIGSLFVLLQTAIRPAPFLKVLGGYVAAAFGLTIVWGVIQTGSMFNFNSYFNFALLFAVLIVFAIVIAWRTERTCPAWLSRTLFILAIPLLFGAAESWRFQTPAMDVTASGAVLPTLHQAAKDDGSKVKFLSFQHEEDRVG